MNEAVAVWMYATPLVLAASGDAVVQRSGMLNIGIEGQMLVGAFGAVVVCETTGNPWLGLAAGTLAGAALAALAALFAIRWLADQVVVGAAATLLAFGLTSYGFHARYGESGRLLSVPQLPKWAGIDAAMAGSIVLAAALSWFLFRTRGGMALRAAGEYPEAAEAARFSVPALRTAAILLGGCLAGCAGAYLALGIAGSFSENMTQGRGFVAIAMVSFGRWTPHWAGVACLLIGWLDSLQYTAQAKGWAVPAQLLLGMPYAAALLVLVLSGRSGNAPAALGRPFRRSR